jgi:hypothetical protein
VSLTTERARKRRQYEQRKADGQCTKCGGEPLPDSLLCQRCWGRKAKWDGAYIARMRSIWRALHICTTCGQREKMRDASLCAVCSEQQEDYRLRNRKGVAA